MNLSIPIIISFLQIYENIFQQINSYLFMFLNYLVINIFIIIDKKNMTLNNTHNDQVYMIFEKTNIKTDFNI